MKVCQIVKKIPVKDPKTCQIVNILFGKMKLLDIVYQLFKARSNGITATAGLFL